MNKQNITVFLCTRNGEEFLGQQIESIAKQTLSAQLVISDDGSTDRTLSMIEDYRQQYPGLHIQLLKGPQKGFQHNFLSFLTAIEPSTPFMAFCDQDDIWEVDKLERAVNVLSSFPTDQPNLYGSRTRLINTEGQEIGLSPLYPHPPSFANALAQSIAGGNTMVLNATAWNALRSMLPTQIVSHDWWMYQIISGIGGNVYYDSYPSVRYRQHDHNVVGQNISVMARLKRLRLVLNNQFKEWNDIQLSALLPHIHRLTPDNQRILNTFIKSRESSFFMRLVYLHQSGLSRQTQLGMIGLWVAALLGKY